MKGYIKMNNLSNHKRKIMQFSLTPQSQTILKTMSEKYGTNKSIVIDRALELLAAKYHMTINIKYELIETPEKQKYTDDELKEMSKIAEAQWID